MSRGQLVRNLEAYARQWTGEAAVVERFIRFVERHPDCFERALPVGHVTGSAWVVNGEGTHVLLTHHRKLDKWLQLGGHADGEPDVMKVALREVAEESGLTGVAPVFPEIFDVDIHPIPARRHEPAHEHYDIRYAFRTTGSEAYVVSDESHDLEWVPIAALHRVTTEESMLRMARKWERLRNENRPASAQRPG